MTGKQMYELHCRYFSGVMREELCDWSALAAQERADWELRAHEQELRDREVPARLRELEKGVRDALPNRI